MADILKQEEINELLDLCEDLCEDSVTSLQGIISLLKNKQVSGTYDNIRINLSLRETNDIITKLTLAIQSLESKKYKIKEK